MTIAKADLIGGMAKGMAVLESFDTERQRLNATLAAQRAGITRAAARRHLLTLAHLGYLDTDGSYFWLSTKVLRFSGSYLSTARLPRTVQPTLNRLAAQAHESFSVAVQEGDSVVIVARSVAMSPLADASQPNIRLLARGMHLGARLPIHATSTGRVLLAAMPRADFSAWLKGRALAKLTPFTVVDSVPFRQLITQVRQNDYCLASQEHELGVHALAVPLRNTEGKTVAALNTVMPYSHLQQGELLRELLRLMQEAALELRPLL